MSMMNVRIDIDERPWPLDDVFKDLASLRTSTTKVTENGYYLVVDFDGQEVIFVKELGSEDHFRVIKELGQLQSHLSFNLALSGPIPLKESVGFSSSWPDNTALLVAKDFDGPFIATEIPSDSASSVEALEEFVHTFLDGFQEKAKTDILHANKFFWGTFFMVHLVFLLVICIIVLICYCVFQYGPFWLQMVTIGVLVVAFAVGWCLSDDDDD